MTAAPRNRAWVALGIVLSAAFAFFAHAAIVDGAPRAVGAVLSLVPLTLLALWAVRGTRYRVAAAATMAFAAAALWFGWGELESRFTDLFFLEHAGGYLILGIVFGRTLAAGREPLCTRFARLVHGSITPDAERYSRAVTIAWTVLFAAVFSLSCMLYLGGLHAAWSLLANFISPALVVAMFVIEYAVRVRVLPQQPRVGILGGVRAFSRHFGRTRFETHR